MFPAVSLHNKALYMHNFQLVYDPETIKNTDLAHVSSCTNDMWDEPCESGSYLPLYMAWNL